MRRAVRTVTFGLLGRIFFGFVGLNLRLTFGAWPLIVAVVVIAFFGKLFGGIIGGGFAGFRGRPPLPLGVGPNARGRVERLPRPVGRGTGRINNGCLSA